MDRGGDGRVNIAGNGTDDDERHANITRIWQGVDASRIVAMPLDSGTAAQIIRAYGDMLIQVNVMLPTRLRMVVAQHVVRDHQHYCSTTRCAQARRWLAQTVEREAAGA